MGSSPLTTISVSVAVCLAVAACQDINYLFDRLGSSAEGLTPGRKLVALPDEVWKQEKCEARPLPYIRLDRSDIQPKTAQRGDEIVYTLVYSACVPQQPGYVLGEILTHIYFKDRLKSRRSDTEYPVETGKWVVNTEVAIPVNAEPGMYDVEAVVSAGGATIRDRISFNVEK